VYENDEAAGAASRFTALRIAEKNASTCAALVLAPPPLVSTDVHVQSVCDTIVSRLISPLALGTTISHACHDTTLQTLTSISSCSSGSVV